MEEIRNYFFEHYPFLKKSVTILLPVKPIYANKLLSGEKKIEYRKINFIKKIDYILLYSSFPIKKIIGILFVSSILREEKNVIWEKTNSFSGITKEYFDEYYVNHNIATAIVIDKILKIEPALSPLSIYSKFKAPQSFTYLCKV